MPAMSPFFSGFSDELIKIALTARGRAVRRLYRAGNIEEANRVARGAGNYGKPIKDSWMGSQIAVLGQPQRPGLKGARYKKERAATVHDVIAKRKAEIEEAKRLNAKKIPRELTPAQARTFAAKKVRRKYSPEKGTAEGTPFVTAHPTRGISATKVYHPEGLAGPGTVETKRKFFENMKDDPRVVGFKGETTSPLTGAKAHHLDVVQGRTINKKRAEFDMLEAKAKREGRSADVEKIQGQRKELTNRTKDVQKAFGEAKDKYKMEGADLHGGNIMVDKKSGRPILTDPMLQPKGTAEGIASGKLKSDAFFGKKTNITPSETIRRVHKPTDAELAPHVESMQKNPLVMFQRAAPSSKNSRHRIFDRSPGLEDAFENGLERFIPMAEKNPAKFKKRFDGFADDVKKDILASSDKLNDLWS